MVQIERALDLDQLNSFLQGIHGLNLTLMGRYDDAIAQLRKSVTMVPSHRRSLWHALHLVGTYEEALAEARQYFAAMGHHEAAEALERGYAEAGYQGAMRRAAETLAARSEQPNVIATSIAELYICAGDQDRALEWARESSRAARPRPSWSQCRSEVGQSAGRPALSGSAAADEPAAIVSADAAIRRPAYHG